MSHTKTTIGSSTRRTTDLKYPLKSNGTRDMRTTPTNQRK